MSTGRKKTLPCLIDMLVEATVSGDEDRVFEIRQTLDWRLDQLYWRSPREIHSAIGLEPGAWRDHVREDVAALYA
jgi:hypothetical protein